MTQTLREWLKKDDFTLTMSSGFFGFYAHLGFLSVLEEENIIPNKITGSSAGALVGGIFASGLSTKEIKDFLFKLNKEAFWDPIGFGGLLRGDKFKILLDSLIPIRNINNTKIKLKLSTFNLNKRRTEVLEDEDLVNAIYASCAVPFMFQPLVKNKNLYFDGGVLDRPGLAGAEENERVFYHHLVSNSMWRKKLKLGTSIPQKNNMVSLSIKNLPKVRPNNLKNGVSAYEYARNATKKALDIKIKEINSIMQVIV